MIELAKIKLDGQLQSRVELDQSVVAEYAEAYRAGVSMPPVTVFFDGSTYWLADGFHRYSAACDAGLKKIHENVIPGSFRDAILFSVKANDTHGLRRSNADKRRAVESLLADAEWVTWSNGSIAKACSVTPQFVGQVRASVETVSSNQTTERKYTTKHGTTATMETADIGKNQKEEKPVVETEPAQPAANESEYNPQDDELSELHETVRSLADENDALKDRLLVADNTEAGDLAVLDTISELRNEIKRLEIENRALVSSRDSYQRDNADLKTQCAMYRKQISKLQKVAA